MDDRLNQLATLIESHEPIDEAGAFPSNGNGADHSNIDLHRAAILTADTMRRAWLQAAYDTEQCAQALFAVQTDLRAKMARFADYCKSQAPLMADEVHRAVKTAGSISESMSSLTQAVTDR